MDEEQEIKELSAELIPDLQEAIYEVELELREHPFLTDFLRKKLTNLKNALERIIKDEKHISVFLKHVRLEEFKFSSEKIENVLKLIRQNETLALRELDLLRQLYHQVIGVEGKNIDFKKWISRYNKISAKLNLYLKKQNISLREFDKYTRSAEVLGVAGKVLDTGGAVKRMTSFSDTFPPRWRFAVFLTLSIIVASIIVLSGLYKVFIP
ncbi:hypothetical protein ACFL0W_00115 [Nanoarchaeota archaeon]